MSSNYSISASESSSFCTNTSLNHTHTRHGAPAATLSSARGARPVEAASLTSRGDVTPKKAAQSTKSAAATQESPSMTIRRVPADYSKRMEDQKARSSALERYKMLVKGNRLVPSDGDASPEPKKAPEVEEADMSATWRRSDQIPPSSAFRAGSAASQTVLSDVSEEEEEAAAATPAGRRTTTGRSRPRKSADPRPPRSVSRRQPPQQQREHSSSTPVSVSVSVERPAYPNSVTPQRDDEEEPPAPAATTVMAIPTLDLNKTQAHQPVQQQQQQQPASAVRPSYSEAEEGAMAYVSPELTQPFGHTSLRPRSTLRPGYEPVTEHRSASLTRSASLAGDSQLQRTPRRQPASQVRSHSSAVQDRQGVSAQSPTTPRRKSTAKPRAAEAAAAASASDAPETRHVDVAATPESQDSTAEGSAQPIVHQTDGGVVPLPGSKTAFWMRPSSAMFEMTTSIAAKRKDHVEQESATARTSSTRRASRSYHAIPTGSTGSPCGTPRGLEAEERPRFSTHVSATDRKLYQEGGAAAAAPPAATTYDAIFSQRHSTRRSQKVGTVAADATASSTPRGTPRGGPQQQQQQRRAAPRAGGAVRSPSSLSRLSSSLLSHTPKEEEVGRVSTRQHDALSKHCARVAAGGATAAAAAPPAAQMKTNRPGKRATPSAPAAAATAQTQQPAAQAVHKRLDYTATETELDVEEEGEGPVPLTVVPHSSDRQAAQNATTTTPTRRTADNAEVEEESSPHTTIHGRRAGDSATPSKSRRREHDTTASPPRDDADAIFAAQEVEMAQEKAAARAQQARAALESCRLARQARAEAFRTSHSTTAGSAVSTNEVVAAMLQGIVQQTRQVLPCYLCGELQCTSGYRAHVSACRPATEAILKEYATAVGGQADIPAEVKARVDELAAQEVPLSTSDVAVRDAFAKACYQCVKSMLVPCRKCGTQLRVHDVKEHEMLCGRAYYQNSRAAERVRSAVDRIERGSQD